MGLAYAFGRAGRHTRTVAGGADKFIDGQYRKRIRGKDTAFLYQHWQALRHIVFHIFYAEPDDSTYEMHRRYLPFLLETSEVGFRRIAMAYEFAWLVNKPLQSGTKEETLTRELVLRDAAILFDDSEPASYWLELTREPDLTTGYACLLADIGNSLRVNGEGLDMEAFTSDWLSQWLSVEIQMSISKEFPPP